ncbi:MAG: hypothetical protein KBS81_08740 [Spirochaetales bacterium]|nr:hypothetical protein [Candidatus Physcosoma equi]
MKFLKTILLLLCVVAFLLVSCENTPKEEEFDYKKTIIEDPDYNELDLLNPDPVRQEIDIYWTYEGDSADFLDANFTFDVKDQTIGYKDMVIQTIRPDRVTVADGKCHFQIKMGLNYTNDNHVYQLEIKAVKNKKTFAQSDIVTEKKTEGTRLTFEAVVRLLP